MFARTILWPALILSFAIPVAQEQKTIVVTVLDKTGGVVKDVAAGDLAVLEDSATREVIEVKPVTEPLVVAVLVDNTKPTMGKDAPTRELRAGLTALVTTLHASNPATEIGLWEFAGAGVMIQKPTVKTEDLTKRINRMFPSQSTGGVLLEALVDASKELSKKPPQLRRAIVSVSFNSPETSTMDARECAIAIKKARVTYWAVSVQGNADANTSASGGSPVRELIINNVTQATGGVRLTAVTAISLEQQLKSVGDALVSQYLVTYARPSGASAPANIQAFSKKGLKALTGPWVR